MVRIFALNRGRYAFYDPTTGVHLTLENPVSKPLDDELVNVARLERAVRLGTLIDVSPQPKAATKVKAEKNEAKSEPKAEAKSETEEEPKPDKETKKDTKSKKNEKKPESE